MTNSFLPHGLQHARLSCPSPTPGAYPNSCPLGWWCHPTISSSVVPFSSCLQSFPASGSFPVSQSFASGGQSIGVSALASFLPKNNQDWSPYRSVGPIRMDLLDLLVAQGTLKSLVHHSSNVSFLWHSAFFMAEVLTKRGPLGKGMANQYSCLENPMHSMKIHL